MSAPPTVVIAGASGYIGRSLHAAYTASGASVRTIGRGPESDARWPEPAARTVALRLAIVLGTGGGAINPLINLARLGLGGPMGDGGQMFSWVHLADVFGAIEHLRHDRSLAGPVNLAAPRAVTNAELMALLRRAVGRRLGLPTPAWLLEAGARLIRTEAELVLKSRWVQPRRLLESGYVFAFETLQEALADILADAPRGLLPVTRG